MPTITEPGLYQDFDEAEYHADPCPEPSASRTIIKLIDAKTPRHAFAAHPRLNPKEDEDESEPKFDLGKAAHTLVLKRGQKIAEAQFPDWKTNASKEFRAAARRNGLIPMLSHQLVRVREMTAALHEQLPEHGLGHLFKPDDTPGLAQKGRAEVVGAWIDPVGGWSRCMMDWLEEDLTITDYKTTEVDLTEDGEALGRHLSSMGYEVQHAMYERCEINLFPEMEGRVKFRFLFQEIKEPFAIMPVLLPADAIAKGRKIVERGMVKWAAAKASGDWPRFKGGDRIINYPPWSTADYI